MSHLSCPSRWAPESCHQHPPRVCRLQVEDPKGHISKVLCSAWALRLQGAEHRLTAALDQRILTSWCRSSASPRARAPPHPSGPRAGSEPTSPPPAPQDTATLTNSLLLLYMLSSRWQRPSLGVRMAPSFPSPAKWKPSSVANTSSLVTLRQPISS